MRTKRFLSILLTLCMLFAVLQGTMQVSAFAGNGADASLFGLADEVSFANNGYPYGKSMTTSSVTLVAEIASGTAGEVQWYQSTGKDGEYTAITGATSLEYTFTPSFSATNPANWFKCEVNGTYTKAVQLVQAKLAAPTEQYAVFLRHWGGNNQWYVSNGTSAYTVFTKPSYFGGVGVTFNIIGKYTDVYNDTYWIGSSYSNTWEVYDGYDTMRCSFNEANPAAVYFDVTLNPTQTRFAIGADTMLGNYEMFPGYDIADAASLKAVYKAGEIVQIQMVGALTVDTALETDPAFVLAFNTTPSHYWIGYYGYRQAYVYNTGYMDGIISTREIGGSNVATEISNYDSGMTASWATAAGGNVKFSFAVGSVANTGAVTGAVNYEEECIEDLDPTTEYKITYTENGVPKEIIVTSNGSGQIALVGNDNSSNPYNLIGKVITIVTADESARPQNLTIADRPDAPDELPGIGSAEKPADIVEASLSTTQTSVTVTRPVVGQEYSIDNGVTWYKYTGTETIEFTGLTENTSYYVITRISATLLAPASEPSNPTMIKTLPMLGDLNPSVETYNGYYDGASHEMRVDVKEVTGESVTYSIGSGMEYSSTIPSFTDAGNYQAWFKVVLDGYHDYYGTGYVTILPVPITVRIESDDALYDGTVKSVSFAAVLPSGLDVSDRIELVYNSGATPETETTSPIEKGTYTVTARLTDPTETNMYIDPSSAAGTLRIRLSAEEVQENLNTVTTNLETAISNLETATAENLADAISDLTNAYRAADALIREDLDDLGIELGNLRDLVETAIESLEDAIQAVQDNLEQAIEDLEAVMATDEELADAISDLTDAYRAADALIREDLDDLGIELGNLRDLVETAIESLEDAIQAVQDNLERAMQDLQAAIEANEIDIEDKVSRLQTALNDASALLQGQIDDLLAEDIKIYNAIDDLNNAYQAADAEILLALQAIADRRMVSFISNGMLYRVTIIGNNTPVPMPAVPNREGYAFDGWYQDELCTLPFNFETLITENIEIYAKWKRNQFSVTYLREDGGIYREILAEDGATLISVSAPRIDGRDFIGWFKWR